MELYIHYTSLPQDKELPDVVEELNEVLEEDVYKRQDLCGRGRREAK